MANNSIDFNPLMDAVNSLIGNVSSTAKQIPDLLKNTGTDNCCPPKQKPCPPSCILTIDKKAMAGERIIVPFNIKNEHSNTITYQVGIRPLLDQSGNPAPYQPQLSHASVQLQPGQSVMITMLIDLAQYNVGSRYETEIVIRENKFNQNICFRLCVTGYCDVPTAKPWDECSVYRTWNGWQRHYMCPPCTPEDPSDNGDPSGNNDNPSGSGSSSSTVSDSSLGISNTDELPDKGTHGLGSVTISPK